MTRIITNPDTDVVGIAQMAVVTTLPQADVTNLVSDLAGKAASSHTHTAADIASGVFDIARLATGTPTGAKFVRDDGTLATPSAGSVAWDDVTGKPSTFVPSSHTHTQADVTNLVSDLAGKAASSHTHAAADIASGTVATARLGSGAANSSTVLFGDSTWGSPPAGSITNAENVRVGDVPITANTFATACTLTNLAAGTWLLVGSILVGKTATGVTTYTVRLVDVGITAFYASSQYTAPSLNPHYMSIPISAIVVLGSTTTVLLQATSSTASTRIKATPTVNNTNLTDTATYLQAIKLS